MSESSIEESKASKRSVGPRQIETLAPPPDKLRIMALCDTSAVFTAAVAKEADEITRGDS